VTGRQARRRLVLSLQGTPPAADTQVRLTIPAAALQDSFLNQAAQAYEVTFAWPAADTVVQDNEAIELQRVAIRDGFLEIELSEEPSLATTSAIQVDGAAVTWTLGDDRYTLKSASALSAGAHTVAIGTALADLNGGALAEAFNANLSVTTGGAVAVFEAPDPRETPASTIGNLFGFQGLQIDPETGLMYVRNRYYDPEMGRFITTDPLGYVDGPSQYGFAGNSPMNAGDPMGLAELWKHWEVAKGYVKGVGKVLIAPGVFTYNATGSVIYDLTGSHKYREHKETMQKMGAEIREHGVGGFIVNGLTAGGKQFLDAVESGNYQGAGEGLGNMVGTAATLAEAGAQIKPTVTPAPALATAGGRVLQATGATVEFAGSPGGGAGIVMMSSAGNQGNSGQRPNTPQGGTKAGKRDLPLKGADRLSEINNTLDRIESNGPFPYKKDGTVFKNKEGRLPPEGDYREYTVDTPGAPNRGTRRILVDQKTGRTYYTDDHYKNFVEIKRDK
jgi:RHS repeat-associated protein